MIHNCAPTPSLPFLIYDVTPAACGAVRHRGHQDHLEHHAGHMPAGVHVRCDRRAALQGQVLHLQRHLQTHRDRVPVSWVVGREERRLVRN